MAVVRFASPLPSPSLDVVLAAPKTDQQWHTALKEIRELYLECQYKRCAARCDRLFQGRNHETHPLYQAYLSFFSAICYETLGLAAHNLSSKKLLHLEKAKEAFILAATFFPKSSTTDNVVLEARDHKNCAISPALSGTETFFDVDSGFVVPITPITPSFDSFPVSPHEDPFYISSAIMGPEEDFEAVSKIRIPDQEQSIQVYDEARLSTEPSQLDLVPMPLTFKKKVPSVKVVPPARPLPPIPVKRESLSQRRPAIPAAINTHLTVSPRPAGEIYANPHLTLQHASPFRLLLLYKPQTRYNALLHNFQPQLKDHIASITEAITTTSFHRREHQSQKANKSRLASFWCLSPNSVSTTTISPASARPRSTISIGGVKTPTPNDGDDDDKVLPRWKQYSQRDNELQRMQRIERLRATGWKVRKEERGWKGKEYYEGVRRRALNELDQGGRFLF